MRPVAALLLGGLISCCGSGGTASAQAAGTSQAVESPADSVRRDDASMQPAHALDSPSLVFAAGVFALVEAYDYPYSFGVTYVARPLTTWRLCTRCGFRRGTRRHRLHVRGRASRLRAGRALVCHAEPCDRLVHQRRRDRAARSPGIPERHPCFRGASTTDCGSGWRACTFRTAGWSSRTTARKPCCSHCRCHCSR